MGYENSKGAVHPVWEGLPPLTACGSQESGNADFPYQRTACRFNLDDVDTSGQMTDAQHGHIGCSHLGAIHGHEADVQYALTYDRKRSLVLA